MPKNNLFAPPSEEELKSFATEKPEQKQDLFAAPNANELSSLSPKKQAEIASQVEQGPKFNQLESVGLGALQGATLGYGDEAEGGVRALANLPGNKKDLKALYQEYRDIARKRNGQAQEQNPGSYLAGNIGGGIASGLAIPGGASIRGATLLGAATGLGSSKADLTEGDIKGAAIDTGVGAGTGFLAGKAGQALGKALTPEATQLRANTQAVKALGIKALPENLPTGQAALDEGLLSVMGGSKATLKGITDRMTGLENSVVKPTLKSVSENSGLGEAVAGRQSISDIVDNVAQKSINDVPASSTADSSKQAIQKTAQYWSQQLENANGSPQKLNELRKLIDKEARQAGAFGSNPELKPKADFLAQLRDAVNDEIRGISSDVSSGAGTALESAMERQSNLYDAKGAAEKLVNKDELNPPGSITDMLKNPFTNPRGVILGGAVASGNPMAIAGAVGTVGAEKVTGQPIGRLGNIISARTQNQLAKGLETQTGQNVVAGAQALTSKGMASSGVQSGIQNLYNVNDNKLKQVADHFSQQPNTKNLAESLNTAIDSKDEDAKNKILFAMEQRPDIRAQLRVFNTTEEDTNEEP